uniref:DUF1858 domain-containing protein n=1 Tax=Magnetococcus massalia (strain MO-1) TaxID=451514 RepID=A0A1S7LJC5_MAGMO|nr:conserved protein of unknown function [Candidatus Magnetococcus massalia]
MGTVQKKKSMAQLMREYPELGPALEKRGIECASCLAAQVDTLGDVLRMYELDFELLKQEVNGLTHEEAGLSSNSL